MKQAIQRDQLTFKICFASSSRAWLTGLLEWAVRFRVRLRRMTSFSNFFRDYFNESFGLRAKYVFFRAQQAQTGKRGVEHTQSLPVGRVWT